MILNPQQRSLARSLMVYHRGMAEWYTIFEEGQGPQRRSAQSRSENMTLVHTTHAPRKRPAAKPPRRLAVVIRHVPFEDLGNVEASLRAGRFRVVYHDAGIDSLATIRDDVDLLIVLGGPIGAYQEASYPFIRDELRLLENRLAKDLPTLGICLGAQLMARALGANVHPGEHKEIGWAPLIFPSISQNAALDHLQGVPVLHWHSDTFDVPAGAIHLASTEHYQNQAFSWGRNGLALQFHAEVSAGALERWYIGHACEIAVTTGISVAGLRAEAERHGALLQERAANLWQVWLSTLS